VANCERHRESKYAIILKKTVTTVVRPNRSGRFQLLQSTTNHFRTECYFLQVELFRSIRRGSSEIASSSLVNIKDKNLKVYNDV